MAKIVLGGGCFWCTEAVFLQLQGVLSVTSGYMGGEAQTADYESVCTGQTGHIEVILVEFDEQVIDLSTIFSVFFATHDPTTLNRQGNDIGTQYASAIFYFDDEQKHLAQTAIDELKADGVAVVTHLRQAMVFYPAEEYHQNFFAKNPTQGYCNFAIPPKLGKLREKFASLLK
ncbi:peptide-methionine (S)-S-oxide reductase MsrA [Moraxella nasicaprae]|uniref:Peptide methionine sulfoxide reductase MsrA n=1 Tax=Moraxella nasicaprae TaxID=2904122 RepID=A0ABY6F6W2_9GAMM|nr:peptide-methionine (S)-S-oxide reductase MsrA [Moraxella nasicaprae]UXZ05827.1 peptide-methionine (S)-S-oxide reductase MsrA [Moraxella nasicaprae]